MEKNTNVIQEWISDQDGQKIYNMSRNCFRKLAEDAGAVVKIGGVRRSEKSVIDAYLASLRRGGAENDH